MIAAGTAFPCDLNRFADIFNITFKKLCSLGFYITVLKAKFFSSRKANQNKKG
jgi:hypothetical protein